MLFRLAISIFAALLCSSARAQVLDPTPTLTVITIGPGPAIYERYGHVGIRIESPAHRLDVTYDWGNFDFGDPNFLGRFIKGNTRYWMQGNDGQAFLDHYSKVEGRTVTVRRLKLSREQTYRLIDIIRNQDDEDHRFYRYDYYKDNCSTRIRDLINTASDGALESSKKNITPHSFRWHNRRLLQVGVDNVAILTGMEFVTGPRVDAPLSEWDACYLPTLLGETLDHATLADGSPLVAERLTINTATQPGDFEPLDAINPAWWMLPIGLCGGGILVLLARVWPLGFKIGATLWELFTLVGAVFIPSLIIFTLHWVEAWNENVLQWTPFALLVLPALWRQSWRGRFGWAATAALGLSVVGALVTISHLTPQRNAPAVCLALPLHAAVWYGLRTLAKGSRHAAPDLATPSPLTTA